MFVFGSGLAVAAVSLRRSRAGTSLADRSSVCWTCSRSHDHSGTGVITVAFIGILVAGVAGATAAALEYFCRVSGRGGAGALLQTAG